MTIAIQDGLEVLADEIRKYGIEVLSCSECSAPVDALIYIGEHIPVQLYTSSVDDGRGVFIVNACDKSAQEIVEILKRRTYTPLF